MNCWYSKVRSKFEIQKKKIFKKVFGTSSKFHLGVNTYNEKIKKKNFLLVEKFFYKNKLKKHFYTNNFITIKKLKKIGKSDTSFSTRNIPHMGHNLIQKIIDKKKKKLTIFLILGVKNKYNPKILMNSYKALKKKTKYLEKLIFFFVVTNIFCWSK